MHCLVNSCEPQLGMNEGSVFAFSSTCNCECSEVFDLSVSHDIQSDSFEVSSM